MKSLNDFMEINDKNKLMENKISDIRVDVASLKTQTQVLTNLCEKMDRVIEKLVDQQEKYVNKIYNDMEKRRIEQISEVKEINARIDDTLKKIEVHDEILRTEIKELRNHINEQFRLDHEQMTTIQNWKWTVAGGIIVITWLLSHIDYDIIEKVFK